MTKDVDFAMKQFVVGEHIDIHGRKGLYKVKFVFTGYPGRFQTYLKWIKYL